MNNLVAAETIDIPIAVLPENKHDFGAVHEGEEVRHDFILQNKGTAPLEIIDVKTD